MGFIKKCFYNLDKVSDIICHIQPLKKIFTHLLNKYFDNGVLFEGKTYLKVLLQSGLGASKYRPIRTFQKYCVSFRPPNLTSLPLQLHDYIISLLKILIDLYLKVSSQEYSSIFRVYFTSIFLYSRKENIFFCNCSSTYFQFRSD